MPLSIPTLSRILTSFAACALILSLSGCVSRYNPLQARWYQGKSDGTLLLNRCQNPTDYAAGRKCLLELQQLYLEAGTDDLQRSDLLALLVIPTAAAATGVGIAGGPANAITGLSLGAATLFGYGSWYSHPMRAEIFGLGAKALSCVLTASEPIGRASLRADVTKQQRETVMANLKSLKDALAEFKEALTPGRSEPTSATDTSLIEKSTLRIDEAKTILRATQELLDSINSSGTMLWNTAMAINAEIVTAQFKTARDFRDLQEHLQSSVFGLQKDIMGVIPPRNEEPATGQLQGLAMNAPFTRLSIALKELESSIDTLEASLATVQIDNLNQAFAQCLAPVKTIQVSSFLRVTFVTKTTVTPPYTVRFVIGGGQPPYTASLVDSPNDKITLTGPGSSQPAVVDIAVKEGLPPKEYSVLVVDSTGAAKAVKIQVVQSDKPVAPPPATQKTGGELLEKMKTNLKAWTDATKLGGTDSSKWTVFPTKKGDLNYEFELVFDDYDHAREAQGKVPSAGESGIQVGLNPTNNNTLTIKISRDKLENLIASGWPTKRAGIDGNTPAMPTLPMTPAQPVQPEHQH